MSIRSRGKDYILYANKPIKTAYNQLKIGLVQDGICTLAMSENTSKKEDSYSLSYSGILLYGKITTDNYIEYKGILLKVVAVVNNKVVNFEVLENEF